MKKNNNNATTFNSVNELANALVNASPVFGNAYAAYYAIAKAQAKFSKDINALTKEVANAEANYRMARTKEELDALRLNLEKTEERLDIKRKALANAIETQKVILAEVHAETNFVALHKAYAAYATKGVCRKSDYIKAAAEALFDLAGLKHEEDWGLNELEVIEDYATLNVGNNNCLKNKYLTKALGANAFCEMFLRRTIDVLIRENALDVSKYEFTSKKLAKLEAKAEAELKAEKK